MTTVAAINLADENGVDLVEIDANQDPPACRMMDYSKYRFNQQRAAKKSKQDSRKSVVKGYRFHFNISDHDLETKINQMKTHISKGATIAVSIRMRGREKGHKEIGMKLAQRVADLMSDVATLNEAPAVNGNNITFILQ